MEKVPSVEEQPESAVEAVGGLSCWSVCPSARSLTLSFCPMRALTWSLVYRPSPMDLTMEALRVCAVRSWPMDLSLETGALVKSDSGKNPRESCVQR